MEDKESKTQITRSLVNSYELKLLEDTDLKESKGSPTEEKIQICFHTLDEIIPKLGMFQKVIKALRDDLFDGIYSHQYTTQQNNVCRIPFFTLINRIFDQRDEKADELREEISALNTLNNKQEKVIEEKEEQIRNLKKQITEINGNLKDLEAKLQFEKSTVTSLQNSLANLEVSKTELNRMKERKISDLKIELQASFEESKALRVYKNGYDTLQDAFDVPASLEESNITHKVDEAVANKEDIANPRLEQVRKDISIMDTQESQLYYVRNCVIQEYDDYMESKKGTFDAIEHSSSILKQVEFEKDDSVIERESRELATRQSIFTKSITDIAEELSLLLQQRELLWIELDRLQADEAKGKAIRKQKLEKSRGKTTNSANKLEDVDLVEMMAGKTNDPFIPHENILSKYSAMIYTSCNEGKTFYEMPEISYCASCAVKTLLCPHAVTERERIFDLPKNCTHIKITRPEIKAKSKKKRKKTQAGLLSGKDNPLLPRMKLVWENYEGRTTIKRKLERTLSEDYVTSIINEFYALIIWQDDYQPIEEDVSSILDSFYNFLFDRYLLADVVFLAAHDLLSTVEKLANTNKQVHLFASCLDGSTDAATCRYVLLLNEFIESFEWYEMHDFSSFIAIIYPFLQEEDLEQLRMGYTAFSENKIAANLVHDYLLYIILAEKEPRFMETEVKLLQSPVRNPGRFTDIEFFEAMDSMVPLAAERLQTRLYTQSLKHFADSDDTVNVRRISHMTSYLSLIQNTPKINNDIKKWKSEKQQLLIENPDGSTVNTRQKKPRIYTSLVTLSKIKILGAEMARRARSRRNQEEQDKIAQSAYEL